MQDDAKRWDDSLISLGLGALVVVVSGILLYNYFTDQTPKILQNQTTKLASPTEIAKASEVPAGVSTPLALPTNAPASAKASATPTPVATVKPTATTTAKPTEQPTAKPSATVAPTVTTTATASPTASATPAATPSNVASATDSKSLPTKYTVVRGDTLWDLSAKFYGTGFEWKKIAQANKLGNGKGLEVGAVVEIPRNEMISSTATETPAKSSVAQSPAPSSVAQASPAASTTPTVGGPTNAATGIQQALSNQTYTVARGDSLWKIAGEKCGNNYLWSSIARQNKLQHPSLIYTGNTLTFTCQ